jgi:hypothetical protein
MLQLHVAVIFESFFEDVKIHFRRIFFFAHHEALLKSSSYLVRKSGKTKATSGSAAGV